MNQPLRDELIRMDQHDQDVRAELAADGSLFRGYHARMAAVHDANAARLKEIIKDVGWPGESIVGPDGANAAWRIAQHSINHPDFMRECRIQLEQASERGEAPRWQFAFIDDRIRVFEGLPQRYGTQWRDAPGGPEPYPLEDPTKVDEWRAQIGLWSIAEQRAAAPSQEQLWDPDAAAEKEAAELAWRKEVGWIR